VALFVHGVLMNKHLWRHQLSGLSGIRRCIAIDLLAHGDTEIDRDQDVSVIANAQMIVEVLDELHIDRVDIVGNDSGGAISQIFAALNPGRVRTLTLTDCDTNDNWPPAAFAELLEATARGELGETLHVMLADKAVYRSPDGLGMAYERPQSVSDDDIDIYLQPFVRSEQRLRDLERFLDAFDYEHTVKVEPALRQLQAPTLIVWGTDDIYFPMKWAYWLADTIPGAKPPVEIPGGRLFFPEERPEVFNEPLRAHLLAGCDPDSQSASSSEVPA
jgi:pimeloyl-ACP methyl ester carboxylesterase